MFLISKDLPRVMKRDKSERIRQTTTFELRNLRRGYLWDGSVRCLGPRWAPSSRWPLYTLGCISFLEKLTISSNMLYLYNMRWETSRWSTMNGIFPLTALIVNQFGNTSIVTPSALLANSLAHFYTLVPSRPSPQSQPTYTQCYYHPWRMYPMCFSMQLIFRLCSRLICSTWQWLQCPSRPRKRMCVEDGVSPSPQNSDSSRVHTRLRSRFETVRGVSRCAARCWRQIFGVSFTQNSFDRLRSYGGCFCGCNEAANRIRKGRQTPSITAAS